MHKKHNRRSTCLGETVSMTVEHLVKHYTRLANETTDEAAKHTYLQQAEHYKKIK